MGYTSKYKGAEIDAHLEKMVNTTWADLVALRDAEKLIAGQMYRITDYETMTSKEGSQSAGHPFDIIVTALDNKTLDEKASAIQSARDTDGYFASSNLAAWDVRYCLDNDKNRFDWAVAKGKTLTCDISGLGTGSNTATGALDGTFEYAGVTYYKWVGINIMGMECYFLTETGSPEVGSTVTLYLVPNAQGMQMPTVVSVNEVVNDGKGVIYRLIDENENEASYDFKNILFLRNLDGGSLPAIKNNGEDKYVYTFSYYDFTTGIITDHSLNGATCFKNQLGPKCWDNVFLDEGTVLTYNNTMECSCTSNTLEDACNNNRFGSGCTLCVLTGSWSNSLGDDCREIVLGKNCASNTFRQGCKSIKLGQNCQDNIFGIDVQDINFNPSQSDISALSYCHDVRVDGGCKNLVIIPDGSVSSSSKMENIHINSGVSGSSTSNREIITVHVIPSGFDTYVQTVARNSSGTIKVYCEADLVQ